MNESKTPRTDAIIGSSESCVIKFARQLETEIAAANKEITRLKVDVKIWIDNAKALQAQVNAWEPERQKDKSKIVALTAERDSFEQQ